MSANFCSNVFIVQFKCVKTRVLFIDCCIEVLKLLQMIDENVYFHKIKQRNKNMKENMKTRKNKLNNNRKNNYVYTLVKGFKT